MSDNTAELIDDCFLSVVEALNILNNNDENDYDLLDFTSIDAVSTNTVIYQVEVYPYFRRGSNNVTSKTLYTPHYDINRDLKENPPKRIEDLHKSFSCDKYTVQYSVDRLLPVTSPLVDYQHPAAALCRDHFWMLCDRHGSKSLIQLVIPEVGDCGWGKHGSWICVWVASSDRSVVLAKLICVQSDSCNANWVYTGELLHTKTENIMLYIPNPGLSPLRRPNFYLLRYS